MLNLKFKRKKKKMTLRISNNTIQGSSQTNKHKIHNFFISNNSNFKQNCNSSRIFSKIKCLLKTFLSLNSNKNNKI